MKGRIQLWYTKFSSIHVNLVYRSLHSEELISMNSVKTNQGNLFWGPTFFYKNIYIWLILSEEKQIWHTAVPIVCPPCSVQLKEFVWLCFSTLQCFCLNTTHMLMRIFFHVWLCFVQSHVYLRLRCIQLSEPTYKNTGCWIIVLLAAALMKG